MDRNQMTTRILIFTAIALALIATLAVSCAPAPTEPAPTPAAAANTNTGTKYEIVKDDGVDCIVFESRYSGSIAVSCNWK